ncbi:MAG: hypothetical protein JNJ69_13280 [Leptospiraceae bacterium]|nr:hypothetical protein [Leptospiraceae bacterium]
MRLLEVYRYCTLRLMPFLFILPNTVFSADSEREQRLARHEKNLAIAKAQCGTDARITVQLNRGGSATGVCLFLSVSYVTMRVGDKAYSFAIEGDIAGAIEPAVPANGTPQAAATDEQLRPFEVRRLESRHAIGIRFLDFNLIEDPFKFGKIALNYEYRFWFLSVLLEGGADFKAGVAQNSKKYDGMAQMRWLFSKAFDTFYVGAFVNYQNGTTVQNDADSQKRDVEISAYGLGALMGKKWVLGIGLFLDLTLRAGPYFETILSRAANYRYTAGDEITGTAFRTGLGGIALTFSLGYVF